MFGRFSVILPNLSLHSYDTYAMHALDAVTFLLKELLLFAGSGRDTGYGSHNTGSTTENAKSYIPGTDANRESRYEQGRDSGNRGSSNQGYGSGSNLKNDTHQHCINAFCFCQVCMDAMHTLMFTYIATLSC